MPREEEKEEGKEVNREYVKRGREGRKLNWNCCC